MTTLTAMPKYEVYKDSGVEWIGDVPDHWCVIRFRNMFSFSKGLNITKENLQDEGIPCVNYGEVHSKFGFEVNPEKHELKCVDESYLKTNSNSLLNKGDFVFADTSEDLLGSGNFTQLISDVITFAGYHTVIVRLASNQNDKFLAYLFDSASYRNQIRSKVKGVKVFSITKSILKNTWIWLPEPTEQTAIANFLDEKTVKIDEAIAIKEKQIELLKERKQIIIQQAVTQGLDPTVPMKDSGVEWIGLIPAHWSSPSKLKYLSTLKGRQGWQGLKAEEYRDEGPHVLSSAHFNNYVIEWGKCPRVSMERYLMDENIQLKVGDVLLMKDGANMGKLAYVDSLPGLACLNSHLLLFRSLNNENIPFFHSKYMFFHMMIDQFQDYVKVNGTGSTFLGISQESIGNYKIALPPLDEQVLITQFLDKTTFEFDKCISKFEVQIEKLKEYKSTLINSAVTGKIKVV